MAKKSKTQDLQDGLEAGPPERFSIEKVTDLLSTGSTLLNLAISDSTEGGIPKGTYLSLIGDSSSGKTIEAITLMAEACINPAFDNYDIIYDNAENGAFFDVEKLFGARVATRIKPPRFDSACHSHLIEEFYFNVDWHHDQGRPFIYIIDSMDALSSQEEEKKVKELKAAAKKKGAERAMVDTAGLMTDGKAKKNSYLLRRAVGKIEKTGSILVIIGQTRDNMDASYETTTSSGGRALKFYSSIQVWMRTDEVLTKTVNKKKRQIGIVTECRVKKNRVRGKVRTIYQPIYYSVGIDDLGGLVDFLIDEGHWNQTDTGMIAATEFKQNTRRETLVKFIQDNELEDDLRAIVQRVWLEIEAKCVVHRKNKYE